MFSRRKGTTQENQASCRKKRKVVFWEFLRNQENYCQNVGVSGVHPVSNWLYIQCPKDHSYWASDNISHWQRPKQITRACLGFSPSFARQCFLNFLNNLLSPRQTNLFITAKHWLDQKAWFFLCSCNVVSHHHPHNSTLLLFKEVYAQMVLCHGNRHQRHSLQLPLLPPCLCFWHITWISLLLF